MNSEAAKVGSPGATHLAFADREMAIETHGLTKVYHTRHGKHLAVDGLDMRVPRGGVHGFLGPNGSGKTTTIRMLLGLIKADQGAMRVLGQPVPEKLPDVIAQLGAIVEQPRFTEGFSARLNLELAATALGLPHHMVDDVLDQVGLTDRAGDKFKTYSLGMKQRLAIAATLLKDPEVLIFDEPTNGLDPAGIHEIRESIRGLGASGRTVLVSSHILSEVEQMADTVTIIARGHVLAEGIVSDITNTASDQVELKVANLPAADLVLQREGFTTHTEVDLLIVDDVPDTASLTHMLADHGLFVEHLARRAHNLESVFLELTDGVGVGEMALAERAPVAGTRELVGAGIKGGN